MNTFQEEARLNRAQRRLRLNQRQENGHRQGVARAQARESVRQQRQLQRRTVYANLRHEERQQQQHQNALRQSVARANLSQEDRQQQQHHDALRHSVARANLSQEEREQQQHQNALQHLIRHQQPTALFRVATQATTTNETVEEHSCGARDVVCIHCSALKWTKEGSRSTICCANGQNLNLRDIFTTPFPPLLHDLFTWDVSTDQTSPTQLSATTIRQFRKDIRQYNCALQMASSGMVNAAPTQGISMIIALGAVYHLMGPLIPNQGVPKFAQLYIIDNSLDQLNQRMSHFSNTGMSRELLYRLQQCLHENNPFVIQFRQTIQDLQAGNVALEERVIIIGTNGHVDHRRYNAPFQVLMR